MVGILWAILAVVLVVWLIGLLVDVAGNFIHLLLIVAALILIYNVVTGRRSV
ncbi:MAG: lmo0937 family membrane protein [Chloroflexota bacterium]|nr:lmo0937 family membrane protein [Chloroflexota bacterium]